RRRLTAFRHVPKAEAPIHAGQHTVCGELAPVVLAVLAYGINGEAAVEPRQAQRLAVEWVQRDLRHIPGHEIVQALRPVAVGAAIALAGQKQDAAAQRCPVAVIRGKEFWPE